MVETEDDASDVPPVWPAFGDIMACVFGLFVLLSLLPLASLG